MVSRMRSTGEAPASQTKNEIIKEAKRLEESSLHSSKGHLVAARVWSNVHLVLGLVTVAGTAFAAALVMEFGGKQFWAGVLYIGVAVLSGALTFLNPNDKASAHLSSGNHYDALMNRVRVFWTIECWQTDSEAELTSKLQALAGDKDRLNLSSPQIPYWSYKIAKRQIAAGEAAFEVDKT